jgi:hypothetical protein
MEAFMKTILMLPAVAVALILTGCEGIPTPDILALESAVAEKEAPPDIPLAGAWESSSSDQTCLIHKEKDGAYSILFLSGDSPVDLKGRLFRAGDAVILDLTPDGKDGYFSIPGHAFARVWAEAGTLRWGFLDSDWYKEQLKALPSYAVDDRTLLLVTGPALRAFIEKAGADERAVSTQVTWQRMQ